jgi:hypothetical protein
LINVGHVSNVSVFSEIWHDGIVPHVFFNALLTSDSVSAREGHKSG